MPSLVPCTERYILISNLYLVCHMWCATPCMTNSLQPQIFKAQPTTRYFSPKVYETYIGEVTEVYTVAMYIFDP